jgi:hypothetical protein
MPSKGMRLNIKELTETDNRRHYMLHIHGVLFRIIAEVFSSFPNVQTVIVSGYSQRPNKATGNIEDEYLLSTKANRDDWKRINFNNLYAVDPAEAIGSLNTKRKMTKTGIFTPIEPFMAED